MTKKQKIEKIRAIYKEFLTELSRIKKDANGSLKNQIESIEKKEVDKILDKINNNF
ncbi:hypothetical protein HON36_03510 [Candidatus Parcubacteria bacterium]|jgi:hypothetical protein|nr:hypothetical protein [Candidatus Parcubacteria bacterium]MBT7228352.1 hypothetical protein [Candidatus Parcubacteria bacterium]